MNNFNLFKNFIDQNKELLEMKKEYTQILFNYFVDSIENKLKKTSYVGFVFLTIRNFFVKFQLKLKVFKHKQKISNLTDNDKSDQLVLMTVFKKEKFEITVNLEKFFKRKKLIDNTTIIDISDIEYRIYYFISYKNIISHKQAEKNLVSLDDAKKYFNCLKAKLEEKNMSTLLNDLLVEIATEKKDLVSIINELGNE